MSWIEPGMATAEVQALLQSATGYWLGPAVWAGWGAETDRLNIIAEEFDLPGLSHADGGAEARAKINAIIDAMGLPAGSVFAYDATADRIFGGSKSFARASTALWNGGGDWTEYAVDELRRADGVGAVLEPALTELGNYATMAGAALGVLGSGGSLPTGWNISSTTGMTVEVVGIGTTDGLPSIDIDFVGTPTANWRIRPSAAQALVTAPEQSHVASVFMALIDGSLPQADDARFGALWYNSGTGFISAAYQDVALALSADLERFSGVHVSPANADRANLDLIFSVTSGEAIDFTLRFAAPNLGLGSVPSTPLLPNGAPATRADEEMPMTPVNAGALDWHVRYHDDTEETIATGVTGAYNPTPDLSGPWFKLIWATEAV